MICKNCLYVWDYKGALRWATCPSCQSKTKTSEGLTNVNQGDDKGNGSQ